MRCGSVTSSDCSIPDDQNGHCAMSYSESKEAIACSSMDKLATGRAIPSIKFKVSGKHVELHRDERHRNDLRENVKHKQFKARVVPVLGGDRK